MKERTAQTWVRIFAILDWIGGVALVLLGLVMLIGSAAMNDEQLGNALVGNLIGGSLLVTGALYVLLGVFSIVIGAGLWQFRNWARIIELVSAWIGVVFSLIALMIALAAGDGYGIWLVTTFISVGEVWLFGFDPTVRTLFAGQAQPAVQTPVQPVPETKPEPAQPAEVSPAPVPATVLPTTAPAIAAKKPVRKAVKKPAKKATQKKKAAKKR
jgi:hypothetical protein